MQLEVGDMIQWFAEACHSGVTPDTGWVVHIETRYRQDQKRDYILAHWLSNNSAEEHWADWLLNQNCKIIKGR